MFIKGDLGKIDIFLAECKPMGQQKIQKRYDPILFFVFRSKYLSKIQWPWGLSIFNSVQLSSLFQDVWTRFRIIGNAYLKIFFNQNQILKDSLWGPYRPAIICLSFQARGWFCNAVLSHVSIFFLIVTKLYFSLS